jgi:hypothetical protein
MEELESEYGLASGTISGVVEEAMQIPTETNNDEE